MIKIRAVIEHITYQNSENGYSILKGKVKDHNDLGHPRWHHVGSAGRECAVVRRRLEDRPQVRPAVHRAIL